MFAALDTMFHLLDNQIQIAESNRQHSAIDYATSDKPEDKAKFEIYSDEYHHLCDLKDHLKECAAGLHKELNWLFMYAPECYLNNKDFQNYMKETIKKYVESTPLPGMEN